MTTTRRKPWIARVRIDGRPGTTAVLMDNVQTTQIPVSVLTSAQRRWAKMLWPRVGRWSGYPTQTQWVAGFAYDPNPERELVVWTHIADVFDQYRQTAQTLNPWVVVGILLHVSLGTVDIPSQVGGATDAMVAELRAIYDAHE